MGNAAGIGFTVAGIVVGAAAFAAGLKMSASDAQAPVGAPAGADDSALIERLEKVDRRLQSMERSIAAARDEALDATSRVNALTDRIDGLAALTAPAAGSGGVGGAPDPEAAARKRAALQKEFEDLQKKVFSGEATAEEQARFWEMARKTDMADDLIAKFEASVEERPNDVDARMNLSQAYISKLLSIPQGPEQGIWGMKAAGQYEKVLEIDPQHWDARYSLAFNWSQWPDFLNKTPDALREFETLREVQESQVPIDKHAGTYLQLSLLYRKTGNNDKARAALKDGLDRHPNSDELRKAFDASGGGSEEGDE